MMYWEQFIQVTHQPDLKFGSAWAFGMTKDQADNLAKLTYEGVKTATSSLYELYKLENDPLPIANEHYDVLLDGTGNPVGIILTTDVTIHMIKSANNMLMKKAKVIGHSNIGDKFMMSFL